MSDPIKAALAVAADAMFMEAAPDEAPLAGDCPQLHGELVKQAAAAIAAFLRVLHASRPGACWYPGELAAAVERAAKGGRDE
jgi:hypothetical protein